MSTYPRSICIGNLLQKLVRPEPAFAGTAVPLYTISADRTARGALIALTMPNAPVYNRRKHAGSLEEAECERAE
jgi:hypothetical protein